MMGLPARRVDEMLDLVSLSPDEAGRRVRNYSLGMRQRLGIATALLGDPGVLILDEPANGLDPAGIRWMRDLLRDYADGGATVLLSSHLLHEIEVIADDLVVIGQGRIVAQGTKAELLEAAGDPGPHAPRAPTSPERSPPPDSTSPPAPPPAAPTPCASRPTRSWSARSPSRPASRSSSSAPPRAPGSRRCSSSSPQTPNEKEQQHDHPRPRARGARGAPASRATAAARRPAFAPRPIPLSRIVAVEPRKSFDTRSGFWLLASIGITALLATGAVLLWAPDSELTYDTFAAAIGVPMSVLLPVVAILSVTSEWSQRSGLTTFTLVPHRGRIVLAKGIVAVVHRRRLDAGRDGDRRGREHRRLRGRGRRDGLGRQPAEPGPHRAGERARAARRVHARRADPQLAPARSSATSSTPSSCRRCRCCWPGGQEWFRDLQPWVDFNFAQTALFNGSLTGEQWANLGVTGVIWLLVPLAVGVVDGAPLGGQVAIPQIAGSGPA